MLELKILISGLSSGLGGDSLDGSDSDLLKDGSLRVLGGVAGVKSSTESMACKSNG
jgi:hypothetical protein